jgi:3-hydroxyacyl-[acyl-carrier-protein] dehydratase
MLLVDAVRHLEPGRSIVGVKTISGTEPCYADIAEGASLSAFAYPHTLVLESFAQTAGLLVNLARRGRGAAGDVRMLFASLSGLRFTSFDAYPGDTLEHRACLDRELGDTVLVSGVVRVDGRVLAEIERALIAYRPRPQAVPDHRPGVVSQPAAPIPTSNKEKRPNEREHAPRP